MCRKIIKNLTCLILLCLFFLSFFFFVGRRETTWFLSIFLLVDCKCFMNKNRVLPQWVRRWVLTRRSGFRPLPPPFSNSHVRVCGLFACVSPLLLTCEFVLSSLVRVSQRSQPRSWDTKKNVSWTKEILLKEWNEEVYEGRVYLMWKLIYFLTHKVTLEFRPLRRLNQLSWIVMIITIYVWEILSSTCEVEYQKENVEVN